MRKENREKIVKIIMIGSSILIFPVTSLINHSSTAIKTLKDLLNL